ncbi:phosphomannomutase/phosphoglucomutase [Zavarzinia compransoris]|uniref:phosphoglucomutase/phosphomannomutase PgmG n=1 Tax=Zavarzinia marina TaxID=2911065 RepID=UPI001F34F090|nr:phosphomannomutase/phosphoglucomutase [Zavarzinia marina]MCF4166214.1 phosphomannomutase/phosphoglucomutase [Zavarzinia marina]
MSLAHSFHPSILREYDIRGIVGETLHEADARALGRAFATIVARSSGKAAPVIVVGRDGRVSSPMMEAALVDGMVSTGAEVIRIGTGPTPMLYFAATVLGTDGGIQVTGSHNPPHHNGFKMMLGKKSFFGPQIQEVGRISAAGDIAVGSGSAREEDISERYVARLLEEAVDNDVAVGWDPGNGAAGAVLGRVVAGLKGRHMIINEAVDGTFPNHHPDPTEPENLEQLQHLVAENKLDIGIAFDGDGDRIGAIDAKGRIIWGDQLLAILAQDLLAERPGATIIADVKASQVLFDEIARMGGKPLMWKTGHSLIKTKMLETGAPLAGEMSGHIFFADRYYGFDDALYAGLRLITAVVRAGVSLTELRDRLPDTVNTPELRFPVVEEEKFGIVDRVKSALAAEGAEVNDTDGVRVKTADGWWLLRASNTQAVLVARAEGHDSAALERLKASLTKALVAAGVSPPSL